MLRSTLVFSCFFPFIGACAAAPKTMDDTHEADLGPIEDPGPSAGHLQGEQFRFNQDVVVQAHETYVTVLSAHSGSDACSVQVTDATTVIEVSPASTVYTVANVTTDNSSWPDASYWTMTFTNADGSAANFTLQCNLPGNICSRPYQAMFIETLNTFGAWVDHPGFTMNLNNDSKMCDVGTVTSGGAGARAGAGAGAGSGSGSGISQGAPCGSGGHYDCSSIGTGTSCTCVES